MKKKDEYCNKHVNINLSDEIRSYNATECDWLQGVNTIDGQVNAKR